MATVNSREIVDTLIEHNGWYPGDETQVVKIVEYNNAFNGCIAYGLIYKGERLDSYASSPYIHHPRIIWEAKNGTHSG